jgi:hypothetical protein
MLAAFDEVVAPAAQRFQPDILLVSAGYDAHWRDPLAGERGSFVNLAFLLGGVHPHQPKLCFCNTAPPMHAELLCCLGERSNLLLLHFSVKTSVGIIQFDLVASPAALTCTTVCPMQGCSAAVPPSMPWASGPSCWLTSCPAAGGGL